MRASGSLGAAGDEEIASILDRVDPGSPLVGGGFEGPGPAEVLLPRGNKLQMMPSSTAISRIARRRRFLVRLDAFDAEGNLRRRIPRQSGAPDR